MSKAIEKKLLDQNLHIHGCAIRKKGFEEFSNEKEAKDFLVCHLTLMAISGVDYKKIELCITYFIIYWIVTLKAEISTKEIPVHRKKKLSFDEKYVLDGFYCKKVPAA